MKKATEKEAIQMLIQLAPYVDHAILSYRYHKKTRKIHIENGKVFRRHYDKKSDRTIIEVIATVDNQMVTDIAKFMPQFIEFSDKTKWTVDPMILNTPDPEWHWVVNARACCGRAMVRYMHRQKMLFDPYKEADKLIALGFHHTFPRDIMEL